MYYHNHTYRCGHAEGTDEEYVKRAIECGFPVIGFADHAPFRFPNGRETSNRIPTVLAEDYINSLRSLKEKYKNYIDILMGFEMEYYPMYFNDMFSYVKNLGAQYLILGQHFIKNEIPDLIDSNDDCHTAEQLVDYVDNIIGGINTGKFLYIAHPDYFIFDYNEPIYKKEMVRLCTAAKKADIPLELNLSCMRNPRHYPNNIFLSTSSETGNKIIFGMDAHSPARVYDHEMLIKAKKLVKEYNLNLVEKLDI